MSPEAIARARALIRDASLTPSRWPDALDAFASACRAPSGQLVALNGQGEIIVHWLTGVAPQDRASIEAYGLADPRVNPRLRLGLAGGVLETVADQHHVDRDARRRHPIYAEMFEPHGVSFNCQTVLVRERDLLLRASVSRPSRQGPLEPDDLCAFALLAPELQAAARLQITLAEVRNRASLQAMEAMSLPAFLLNEQGRVAGLSSAAEAMVQDGAVVSVRNRRLVAAKDADRPALAAAVAAAIAAACGRPGGPTSSLVLRERSAAGGAVFDVHPLPGERFGFGGGGAALVVARVSGARPGPQGLGRLYGLSAAEAAVAGLVAEGASVAQIAAARGVARSTVQSQMKAVFAKTGVNRQSQLVRLLRDLS